MKDVVFYQIIKIYFNVVSIKIVWDCYRIRLMENFKLYLKIQFVQIYSINFVLKCF